MTIMEQLHSLGGVPATIAGDVPVSVDGVASTPVTGDAAHFSAL